jgi:hypothetical protein
VKTSKILDRKKKKPQAKKPASAAVVATRAKLSTRPTKKSLAKRKGNAKAAAVFQVGRYVTPNGSVSIGIPAFWTLRQTNDDLEVESPSGTTSVIVTAFQRNKAEVKLDARQYLERFLRTAPIKGRPTTEANGRWRAMSGFRDHEGDHWQVEFLSDRDTLLLATMNSTQSVRSEEFRTGCQILRTLTLKEA